VRAKSAISSSAIAGQPNCPLSFMAAMSAWPRFAIFEQHHILGLEVVDTGVLAYGMKAHQRERTLGLEYRLLRKRRQRQNQQPAHVHATMLSELALKKMR
jgi:hypothetical protein